MIAEAFVEILGFGTWQWRPGDALALTDHYDHVKRINTAILAWEPYLLTATSVGAWRVDPAPSTRPAGTICAELSPSP